MLARPGAAFGCRRRRQRPGLNGEGAGRVRETWRAASGQPSGALLTSTGDVAGLPSRGRSKTGVPAPLPAGSAVSLMTLNIRDESN